MQITRDRILDVLYDSISELNEQRSPSQALACSPDTSLEHGTGLDSLGFVNFVALVEEKCQDAFGRTLVLSDAAKTLNGCDPYETVSSLAEYIERSLTQRHSSLP
jgi:acyl carrier protein